MRGVSDRGLTAHLLDEHVAAAEFQLTVATGSASLCSMSRAGEPISGVKYSEGAWAALREVRRACMRSDSPRAAAEEVKDRWIGNRLVREQDGASADWRAYLTGGIDAIETLLEHPG